MDSSGRSVPIRVVALAVFCSCSCCCSNQRRTDTSSSHVTMSTCWHLVVAVSEENEEVVRELLERGCDPNIEAEFLGTPIGWAARRLNYKIAKLLIEHGVDLCKKDKDGVRPVEYGPPCFRKALIEAHSLIDCQD